MARRRCSKPSCARPAIATLTYVYADSTAVLGPLATYAEPHCYDLCDMHSERLTAPRGWEVVRITPDPDSLRPTSDDLEALANAVREAARPRFRQHDAESGAPTIEVARRGHLRMLATTEPDTSNPDASDDAQQWNPDPVGTAPSAPQPPAEPNWHLGEDGELDELDELDEQDLEGELVDAPLVESVNDFDATEMQSSGLTSSGLGSTDLDGDLYEWVEEDPREPDGHARVLNLPLRGPISEREPS